MRFTRQPQYAATVDRGNPLSRGLLCAAIPHNRSDAITGGIYTQDGTYATVIGTPGIGLSTNGSSSSAWLSFPAVTLTKYTIFGVFKSNSSGADARALALGSSVSANPIIQIGSGASAASKVRVFARDNSAGVMSAPDSTAVAFDGTVHTVALTYDGANVSCYIDGVFDSAGAAAAWSFTVDRFCFGALRRSSTAGFWSGASFVGAAWDRALSATEVAAVSANPWQLFRFPTRSRIFAPTAGGGGGDVTVSLTGHAVTASTGTLTTGTSKTLTGSAVTGAQGSLAPARSVGISGTSTAASLGSMAQSRTVALAGQSTTGAQGTVGIVGDVTVALTGQAMAMTQGTLVRLSATPEAYGGGFFEVPHVPRRRTVHEERERLGIIPKAVKQIVQAVARASVIADKTDGQAQAQLQQRLAQQDFEAQARYVEFMQQERDRIMARDIDRGLRIRQRQYELDEDDREAEMLLM